MGHLKDFILDAVNHYSELAPALPHLADNQQEFLALALSRTWGQDWDSKVRKCNIPINQ